MKTERKLLLLLLPSIEQILVCFFVVLSNLKYLMCNLSVYVSVAKFELTLMKLLKRN